MSDKNLVVSIADQVALVTINRPEAMNALNPATIVELTTTIAVLEQRADVHVIILTGAGDKAFVAGGDVALMRTLSPLQARDVALKAADLFQRIENSPCVVIAAINGYALGGGCELALACDLRLAAEKAQLGQPEINLGIIPGWGGTQRLPRLIGVSRAKELMFTGGRISADQALNLGLVDHVYPAEQLIEEARKLAQTIASKPQTAIRIIKEAVNNGMAMDQEKAIRYEAEMFGMCFTTADQKEGMDAFFEKRPAVWKNC
ncbi:enoyl-CoA hydratase-related protein [uncultured Desulfuromusa sp.]|uniref:enoyl-CoA hydratase/isomerase family protein n=1 Tax=uncultured Desulfuromusa sp. TaxID=219183 RepID=UPI002AA7A917|nr:enoyl-CoA hydratase-related protein [uncultured Desulfuromusa sp.]